MLTGDAMPNEIEGGDGGDMLDGGDGADTVSYASSDRRVRVDLGDGTDTGAVLDRATLAVTPQVTPSKALKNIKGTAYGDVLTARSNDTDSVAAGIQGSTLWGLGGDDTLVGSVGNDTLVGGAGADEMEGGYTPSNDTGDAAGTLAADNGNRNFQTNTLSYAGSDAGVTVDLASSTASGGHAQGDEIETYEYNDVGNPTDDDDDEEVDVATFVNVTGSEHNDSLSGDRFGNHLVGGAGDDALRGGAGGDILSGGPGADRLDGGEDPRERDNMIPAIDLNDDDDTEDTGEDGDGCFRRLGSLPECRRCWCYSEPEHRTWHSR